ncbi:glyoxalase [Salinarchaeum sp. Harcht-Bsk1]|uniref:VOC family protein n=1 Tax=Salinarchaeum sp. Harcht-Bsk1 TaxID=1333523 RepID=UPI0003423FA5|nr:VOC family protein [Salinarchaeum sp. Harcht-Bsk1]AGN02104.1 glyoxalase [Salinarchaeum sp. Harcht-Bsk1]
MHRVVHFDIMADDPHRAIEFYTDVFGWSIEKWNGDEMEYWLVRTGDGDGPGIDGGLARRGDDAPVDGQANAFVCAIEVDDVEAVVDDVEAAGGVVTTEVMDLERAGRIAYCLDTEGNQFSLWEEVP